MYSNCCTLNCTCRSIFTMNCCLAAYHWHIMFLLDPTASLIVRHQNRINQIKIFLFLRLQFLRDHLICLPSALLIYTFLVVDFPVFSALFLGSSRFHPIFIYLFSSSPVFLLSGRYAMIPQGLRIDLMLTFRLPSTDCPFFCVSTLSIFLGCAISSPFDLHLGKEGDNNFPSKSWEP